MFALAGLWESCLTFLLTSPFRTKPLTRGKRDYGHDRDGDCEAASFLYGNFEAKRCQWVRVLDFSEGPPLAGGFVPGAEGAGRGSGGDGVGGHLAGDDGVGSNDGAVTDAGPGEDGDTIADPDVRADDDLAGACERALPGALGRRALARTGVEAVRVIGDDDAAAAEDALAQRDTVDAGDVDVIGQIAVGADGDGRRMSVTGEAGDGIEPETIAGGEVVADPHMGETGEPGVPAETKAGGAETTGDETIATAPEDGTHDPVQGEEEAILALEGDQGVRHRRRPSAPGGVPPLFFARNSFAIIILDSMTTGKLVKTKDLSLRLGKQTT